MLRVEGLGLGFRVLSLGPLGRRVERAVHDTSDTPMTFY